MKRRSLLVLAAAGALMAGSALADGQRFLFVQNVQGLTPEPAADYEFSSHTFTRCGQTGPTGPSLSQCRSSYGAEWAHDDAFFSVSSGIQEWVVPADGVYRITAAGAEGGARTTSTSSSFSGPHPGGKGALMRADFRLQAGQVLRILVGQQGQDNGGAGGGSFVVDEGGEPLLVAGGGGGGGNTAPGNPGLATERGGNADTGEQGGDNGQGATDNSRFNGAGFFSDGRGLSAGEAFTNGGRGSDRTLFGGFGGGAAGGTNFVAGGGGGYSGGAPSDQTASAGAGGGGSFSAGEGTVGEPGANAGHGHVAVERL